MYHFSFIFFSNFVAQNEFDRIFERSSLFASFRFWRNSNRSPYSPDLSLGGVFETATRESRRNAIVLLSFLLGSSFPLFLLFENDYPFPRKEMQKNRNGGWLHRRAVLKATKSWTFKSLVKTWLKFSSSGVRVFPTAISIRKWRYSECNGKGRNIGGERGSNRMKSSLVYPARVLNRICDRSSSTNLCFAFFFFVACFFLVR